MWLSVNSALYPARERECFYYVSSYCNQSHRTIDGKPVEHECRIIPPAALRAEAEGDYERANEIMRSRKVRMMRRGIKAPEGFWGI
jgi:hypothetical protein